MSKNDNDNMSFFDGYDEATEYIFNNLSEEYTGKISKDEIEYVLERICDYYDKNGFIDETEDIDSYSSENVEENDIFNFVKESLIKDRIEKIDDNVIQAILDGEFEYGVSIGMYKEA